VTEALFEDLTQAFHVSSFHALSNVGVGSTETRQVVAYNTTLHLLPVPLGEQDHLNPTTLCGRMMENHRVHSTIRGAWNGAEERGYKRCSRCARRAGEVAEAQDAAATKGGIEATPFFPADQAPFEGDLRVTVESLVSEAIAQGLPSAEVEVRADEAYSTLLFEHALASLSAHPERLLRRCFSWAERTGGALAKELGYPGDVEELLPGLDLPSLLDGRLPRSREDSISPTVPARDSLRRALREQLASLAQERAGARRVELIKVRIEDLQSGLEDALAELDDAQAGLAGAPPEAA
jgi:hypothetical protein